MTDMLDNPAVQAIVHNYRNVTRLKAGEFAAAELQAVIRHATFALFSKSVTGEILSWNDGARAIFGYQHAEIVGRHVWTMVPHELREQEQRTRSIAIEEKTATQKIRTGRIRKDGKPLPSN
jgi:PAS domain S-box-containing protein